MLNFSPCSSVLLPCSLIIVVIITLNSFSSSLPIWASVGSSGVLSPSLFETCSSVTSFCLTGSFSFSASGRLVTFPDLGEGAFCRRHAVCPSSSLLSGHPYVGCLGPSVWWTNYCHGLIDMAGSWPSWLPGPALCRACWVLVGGATSWGCWLQNPGGSCTTACSRMVRAGFSGEWLQGWGSWI